MYEKHVSFPTVILTLSNPPSLCTSLNNLKRFKFRYPSTGRLLIGVPIKENTKYIITMLHFLFNLTKDSDITTEYLNIYSVKCIYMRKQIPC